MCLSLNRTRSLFCTMIGLTLWLWSVAADAACWGRNHITGQRQQVREIYRTSYRHPGRFIAEATASKSGQPLIIYYNRYARLPAFYKSFVRQHECCHHWLRSKGLNSGDEIAANCCALRRMRVSKRTARRIKGYMIRNDINSDVVVNSPGVGLEFWARTIARCPRAARAR